ncbi:hypothetical protein X777_10972 [Ooceraea biroi]|uniref:Uncharacterized protein n=1 Tax=Ooceraea biroi TaxID=2015173 RepID=A0A026W4V7_OOCBI|nr:hypothetical protein X777_10972 [Ooceraea biroi]
MTNPIEVRNTLVEKRAILTCMRVKKESQSLLEREGGNAVNGLKDGSLENGLARQIAIVIEPTLDLPRDAIMEKVASPISHEKETRTFLEQADDEMPITEILKKAQENARTKYEEPVPLLELSTDTIYIQGRSGFSAVKIGGFRRALENDTTRATKGGMADDRDFAETQTHTLIRVAITAQKFWKRTGLVYQGLLGGMALLHFMMIHFFFDTSREFVSNYSIFSEAYANIFSFLITLCVISIFDKFDLVRLDMDHLREIYADHAKTALSIPLYLVTFGLHQVSSKIDDQLALAHYYNNNETTWSNNTMSENFFDELNGWQKITTTKDLLAVFAWLFVALGTRDNMLLMHLESMEKYASDEESPT